jgi:hypothetical protein
MMARGLLLQLSVLKFIYVYLGLLALHSVVIRLPKDRSRDMVSIRVFYFEKFGKMYSDGMFLFVIFQHCYHAVCDTTALLDGLKE